MLIDKIKSVAGVSYMRAAQYIAFHKPEDATVEEETFSELARNAAERHLTFCKEILTGDNNLHLYEASVRESMSEAAGAIRSVDKMREVRKKIEDVLTHFAEKICIPDGKALHRAYRLKDAMVTQQLYLAAMEDYAAEVGGSRGSAIYTAPDGQIPKGLEEVFRFRLDDGNHDGQIQLVRKENGKIHVTWREVRPLPMETDAFETLWKRFRETHNVD